MRGQKIKQLEQKWGSEVKALKQEREFLTVSDCWKSVSLLTLDHVGRRSDHFSHAPQQLQDLHRTILAHNHNSDLMRHHRDALDEAVCMSSETLNLIVQEAHMYRT